MDSQNLGKNNQISGPKKDETEGNFNLNFLQQKPKLHTNPMYNLDINLSMITNKKLEEKRSNSFHNYNLNSPSSKIVGHNKNINS